MISKSSLQPNPVMRQLPLLSFTLRDLSDNSMRRPRDPNFTSIRRNSMHLAKKHQLVFASLSTVPIVRTGRQLFEPRWKDLGDGVFAT